MRIGEGYPEMLAAAGIGAGAEAIGFALPDPDRPARGDAHGAGLDAVEGRLERLGRELASLRGRHAAIADSGGRFIHHLGARIASIETAIGALRATILRKERESEGGLASKEAELGRLESSLREIRGFSGVSEAELAGMLAHLTAAQGDAEALLAMIERMIAALRSEFAAARA